MEESELIACMKNAGYTVQKVEEKELPNGKKFVRIDFNRN